MYEVRVNKTQQMKTHRFRAFITFNNAELKRFSVNFLINFNSNQNINITFFLIFKACLTRPGLRDDAGRWTDPLVSLLLLSTKNRWELDNLKMNRIGLNRYQKCLLREYWEYSERAGPRTAGRRASPAPPQMEPRRHSRRLLPRRYYSPSRKKHTSNNW